MFVITTDGMENASHIYSADEVRKMVERQKEKYGWEFLFIGANIDSVRTARSFGIGPDRAVNYHADKAGTAVLYEAVSETVCNVRANRRIGADWGRRISNDYSGRKKNSDR